MRRAEDLHRLNITSVIVVKVRSEWDKEKEDNPTSFTHKHKLLPSIDFLNRFGQEISSLSQIAHDRSIPRFTKSNKLVVYGIHINVTTGEHEFELTLPNNLHGALREVKRERNLRRAEVVNGEENLLGKEMFVTPNGPSDASISQSNIPKL